MIQHEGQIAQRDRTYREWESKWDRSEQDEHTDMRGNKMQRQKCD